LIAVPRPLNPSSRIGCTMNRSFSTLAHITAAWPPFMAADG
jgi:hypothetical protein